MTIALRSSHLDSPYLGGLCNHSFSSSSSRAFVLLSLLLSPLLSPHLSHFQLLRQLSPRKEINFIILSLAISGKSTSLKIATYFLGFQAIVVVVVVVVFFSYVTFVICSSSLAESPQLGDTLILFSHL